MLDARSVLNAFKEAHHPALSLNELKKTLKVRPHETPLLRRLLRTLVKQEQILKLQKGEFAVPLESGLITGVLEMNPRGFGFVRVAQDEEDIYIHRENLSSAMHGDHVVVSLISSKDRDGRIVKILTRANEHVIGTLIQEKKIFFVIPDNPRIIYNVIISPAVLGGAHPQDKVVVKIIEWPSKRLNPEGEVIEILGAASDPRLDSLSIARTYGFPLSFPKEVEEEALAYDERIPAHERNSRWDLTHQLTFTIDPVDARDFDDALSIEKKEKGWRLGLHIADVSYYVPSGSKIDGEALKRSCTVYFSDRAIRMLPEKLSRHICSLDEGKERLAKTILADFDEEGNLLNWELGQSIVRSSKRFSYEEALHILSTSNQPRRVEGVLFQSLYELERLTRLLLMKRMARGALELDLPELEIHQDGQGRVLNIDIHFKDMSHRLVEECMLVANTLVAYLMVEKGLPGIYRIHENPSVVDQEEFKNFIRKMGVSIKTQLDSSRLQALTEQFKSKPLSPIVNMAILRSLREARYSSKNSGHFALALEYYTHFTSPIRRYPDLLTHQVLDDTFFANHKKKKGDVAEIALQCSRNERMADKAEREFNDLKRLRFLKERLEKKELKALRAVVVDVREFGVFVQEQNTLAEGLIHVASLKDDFYVFDPEKVRLQGRRTHKQFKLGDVLWVKVAEVDLYKRQIDFDLVAGKHATTHIR